ncbi:ATP F0F1 synthase subunit gamma [Peptococcaceae bacterium SCADC1_2_3]|jgi:F-type H+-transporting ATPase subunit gamma|nr:ATP F0F1 synthase subunit gamma [Peptococcaceae bacterium SCADC1_2_3]KFI37064.1 ATP F0F1 synthase subunit gamma [Peptococcaceae bacterium SCADC1_2_3]KFI37656.1 ATP F0F1 synthase subunit gamma [Peptococcaceae bacterium SCADC1_2_3]HBQ29425.1 F0F1 ATP synthase subunit gamma [Desulfotomaculum sp.]HCJ78506.1 F0F1 ATP synthase subunit gamma [Desulfotomaculum sp.]
MLSIRDLRRKIKSVESTQQITKAMKAVAAAKMRRAQEDVVSARPYARRLREVLGRVAISASSVRHPLLEVREPKKVAFLIVTADRGLCGGFNSNLIRLTSQEAKNFTEVDFICAGRKGRDFFRRLRRNIIFEYIGLGETVRVDQAREIAAFVMQKYEQKELDVVYVTYSEFVNVLIQRPKIAKLLPIEPPEESGEVKKVDYIFEPEAEEIMAEMLPMYVENFIFHALLESKASEQSARMTAMDNATENANEIIGQLTLQMNKARQAAITKELLEIVSGAAALE